jgi:hypothetical protein
MRAPTRMIAVPLTALLVLSSAPSAHAERRSMTDRHRDVYVQETTTGAAASERARKLARGVDATGLRVNHGRKYVSVTILMADMKYDNLTVGLWFSTVKRKRASHRLEFAADSGGFEFGRIREGQGLEKVCGRAPDERGSAHSVVTTVKRRTNGYVKVRIPRFCLGYPDKVAVAAVTALVGVSDLGSLHDAVNPRRSDEPRRTGWVRRG